MIRVKSLDFLKNYPAFWTEDIWSEHTETRDGKLYFSVPTNLDPSDYDFDYDHGTCPTELEPLIDGSFFIDNVDQFLEPLEVVFYTFYDAEEFYFYKWDGKKLFRASVEVSSRYEELQENDDHDSDENDDDDDVYSVTGDIVDSVKSSGDVDPDYLPEDDEWRVIYEKK